MSEEAPIVEPSVKHTRTRKVGSRAEVLEGICERTSGGLRKEDLLFNERTSKIITKREAERGQKMREIMAKKKELAPIPEQAAIEEPVPEATEMPKPKAKRGRPASKKAPVVEF